MAPRGLGMLLFMRWCVADCCRLLQSVAVYCRACCSVLQCVAVWHLECSSSCAGALFSTRIVCCNALQCVAVRCSALQCVAVRCSALQSVLQSVLQCVAEWHLKSSSYRAGALFFTRITVPKYTRGCTRKCTYMHTLHARIHIHTYIHIYVHIRVTIRVQIQLLTHMTNAKIHAHTR